MTANVGKAMRLKRVIDPDGVSVICALDHGMTSPTFLEPLADIETRTREAVAGGANVIMMSKGMIRVAQEAFAPTTSLALLLSASAGPGSTPAIGPRRASWRSMPRGTGRSSSPASRR